MKHCWDCQPEWTPATHVITDGPDNGLGLCAKHADAEDCWKTEELAR